MPTKYPIVFITLESLKALHEAARRHYGDADETTMVRYEDALAEAKQVIDAHEILEG